DRPARRDTSRGADLLLDVFAARRMAPSRLAAGERVTSQHGHLSPGRRPLHLGWRAGLWYGRALSAGRQDRRSMIAGEKILVTGVSGLVGLPIARYLVERKRGLGPGPVRPDRGAVRGAGHQSPRAGGRRGARDPNRGRG